MNVKVALKYLVLLTIAYVVADGFIWMYRYLYHYEYWGVNALSEVLWAIFWMTVLYGVYRVVNAEIEATPTE